MPWVHELGTCRLPMLTMHERDIDAPGAIHIGGIPDGLGRNLGDVWARSAKPYGDGVALEDVRLTCEHQRLSPAGSEELLQYIVYEAFESIGEDCFTPSIKHL